MLNDSSVILWIGAEEWAGKSDFLDSLPPGRTTLQGSGLFSGQIVGTELGATDEPRESLCPDIDK